jgi:serine/threonine protein kinase
VNDTYKKILNGQFEIPSKLSDSAKDLIKKILVIDPYQRLNIEQILDHKWFNETKVPDFLPK